MTWRFALLIDPAASADARTDFSDTFAVIDPATPALSVGELSTQRGDGIFEKQFVKVAEPKQQERFGVLFFDGVILPHHRRQVVRVVCHRAGG